MEDGSDGTDSSTRRGCEKLKWQFKVVVLAGSEVGFGVGRRLDEGKDPMRKKMEKEKEEKEAEE